MVVGQLESFGQKTAHDVVLHRIREQFVGASVYIIVEMLLWRRSARVRATVLQQLRSVPELDLLSSAASAGSWPTERFLLRRRSMTSSCQS